MLTLLQENIKNEDEKLQPVRPTSALKKKQFFNIESYSIRHSINIYKDKSIIDIFAGSGLIGLEAVSRGIKKSYFIEDDESVFKILKRNCEKFVNLMNMKLYLKRQNLELKESLM